MKVLVCDPDAATRWIAHHEFVRAGYEVEVAGSEEEALRKVRTLYCEMVILDGTGIGLAPLRALRRAPWSADVPCIVLAASAEVGAIAEAYAAGADMVLTKPFNPQELAPFRRRD